MDAEKLLIFGGLAFLGYKLVKTANNLDVFTRNATPVLRDAQAISGNVRNLTGSLASVSNVASAVASGLSGLAAASSSAPRAVTPSSSSGLFGSGSSAPVPSGIRGSLGGTTLFGNLGGGGSEWSDAGSFLDEGAGGFLDQGGGGFL